MGGVAFRGRPDNEVAILPVGLVVRRLRREKGWKQWELAVEAGVVQGMVSYLETGRRDVHITTLRRITDALGVTVSEVVAEAERMEKEAV